MPEQVKPLSKWQVSHDYIGWLTVEAIDERAAVREYCRQRGIVEPACGMMVWPVVEG